MLLSVVCDTGCHNGANLGIGHTEVGVQTNAAEGFANAVDLSQIAALLVGDLQVVVCPPTVGRGKTEGLGGPAVTHIVELQTALCDLRFALSLPLHNDLGRNLLGGTVSSVMYMIVVGIVVEVGVIKLDHIDVDFLLCIEINGLQHTLLEFCTFVAVTAESVIRLLVILLCLDILERNVVTVNAGVEPATAVETQEAVYGKENASGVGAGQNAALFIGIDVDDVIQNGILGFVFKTEVLKQSQTESVFGIGIVGDGDVAAFGHHHAQIFLQLFCGKVDHVIGADLFDFVHSFSPLYIRHNFLCYRLMISGFVCRRKGGVLTPE